MALVQVDLLLGYNLSMLLNLPLELGGLVTQLPICLGHLFAPPSPLQVFLCCHSSVGYRLFQLPFQVGHFL